MTKEPNDNVLPQQHRPNEAGRAAGVVCVQTRLQGFIHAQHDTARTVVARSHKTIRKNRPRLHAIFCHFIIVYRVPQGLPRRPAGRSAQPLGLLFGHGCNGRT